MDAVSVSASTGTAGPSVNIIERMSSAVRRLESDLASTKEEMARVLRQRDEAREECVKLMSEVEEKRKLETALKELQLRFDKLENRYVHSMDMTDAGIMKHSCYWARSRNGCRSWRWISLI